jgi:hypothetical protein
VKDEAIELATFPNDVPIAVHGSRVYFPTVSGLSSIDKARPGRVVATSDTSDP